MSLGHLGPYHRRIPQQGWLKHVSPEKWNHTAVFLVTFQSPSSQVKCCSTPWLKTDSLNSSHLSLQGSSIKPRAQKSFFFKGRPRREDYHHLPRFPLLRVLLPRCFLKRCWYCFDSHSVLQCFNPRNVKEGNRSRY